MELGEAEALGIEHEHDARIGHVDSHFDHGRRHEHVNVTGGKRLHALAFNVAWKPAVQFLDAKRVKARFRPQHLERGSDRMERVFAPGRICGSSGLRWILRINARTHDECLAAGVDFLEDALPHALAPRGIAQGNDK